MGKRENGAAAFGDSNPRKGEEIRNKNNANQYVPILKEKEVMMKC
jgi:hypothetical protein